MAPQPQPSPSQRSIAACHRPLHPASLQRRDDCRQPRRVAKDSLSSAFNRGIEVKLATELKPQNRKQKLSVALIDVDYFKSINDIQGHAAGDAALRDVAETISTHLRGRDYLGRYGGDEFLLILPQTACSILPSASPSASANAVSNLSRLQRKHAANPQHRHHRGRGSKTTPSPSSSPAPTRPSTRPRAMAETSPPRLRRQRRPRGSARCRHIAPTPESCCRSRSSLLH